MKNYLQDGETIVVAAPRTVASGAGVIVGALFGIASADAASGSPVALLTEGVITLPKLSTAVFAAGGKASWDDVNHRLDAPGAGLFPVGLVIEAAGAGTTTAKLRLDGIATAAA